ncbi:MAG: hypothetical protein KDJ98_06915 [Rhodobacteraceae bacterium]|nr:hypothetical protein [Paracoccaceae bacterium]
MTQLRLLPLLFVAACTWGRTPEPPPPPPEPTEQERIVAECQLLDLAAERMTAHEIAVQEGLHEGCPGVTARDTRPLADQTAALRIASGAGLPPGVPAGGRAEVVFRRMITRGVPVEIAYSLAQTPVFRDAVR